jgi:hypothetical protein
MLSGCFSGFYRHQIDDEYAKQNWVNPNEMRIIAYDQKNHIVMHVGADMKTLQNVKCNKSADSIVAFTDDFKGEPLNLYMKVLSKRNNRAYRPAKIPIEDAQQMHLFVDSYSIIDSNKIVFSLNDLKQIDLMKQAEFSNGAINTVIVGGTAAGAIVTFTLIIFRSYL